MSRSTENNSFVSAKSVHLSHSVDRDTWHIWAVVFFVVTILIGMWTVTINNASQTRQTRLQEIVKSNDDLVKAYEEHVRRVISGADMMLRLIQASHHDRSLIEAHFAAVRQNFASTSFLSQLFIANETGVRTSTVLPSPKSALDVDDRAYFKEARGSSPDELIISTPHIGRYSSKLTVVLARRLPTSDNSFKGITAAGLNVEYFAHFYRTLQVDVTQATMIVGRDGIVRFRQAGDDSTVGQNIKQAELFKHLQTSPVGNYRALSLFDGKARHLSYRALADYPLIVVVSVNEDTALKETEKHIRLDLMRAFAWTAFLLIFAGTLVRSLFRQRALTGALQQRELSLMKEVRLSNSIHDIVRDLLSRQKTPELIQRLLREVRTLVDAPIASLALYDKTKEQLVIIAWESEYFPGRTGSAIPKGKGISTQVLQTGQALYDKDYRVFPNRVQDPRLDRITSSYTLPLKAGDTIFGTVAVQFLDTVRDLSDEERNALDRLFEMASLILTNAELYEQQGEELAREKILSAQVRAAGFAQRLMLPHDQYMPYLHIRTVFEPYHPVSGDSYGIHWNHRKNILYGYILDITGHSVTTALQSAAVNAIVHRLVNEEPPLTPNFLLDLNRQLQPLLMDEVFAGFLGFVFDFNENTLTYGAGGINRFWAFTGSQSRRIEVPGCFLGIVDKPDVTVAQLTFSPGDCFYFLTDGLDDRFTENLLLSLNDFDATLISLQQLATAADRWDDCAAICFHIRSSFPPS